MLRCKHNQLDVRLEQNEPAFFVEAIMNDANWHHGCFVWSSVKGAWQVGGATITLLCEHLDIFVTPRRLLTEE